MSPLQGEGRQFDPVTRYHASLAQLDRALGYEPRGWGFEFLETHQIMESNAAGMVLRLALKTRFSEMGWGSTPLLSASYSPGIVRYP